MSAEVAPLAIAGMVLVLFVVVGIVLIPILDRAMSRRAAVGIPVNDNGSEAERG